MQEYEIIGMDVQQTGLYSSSPAFIQLIVFPSSSQHLCKFNHYVLTMSQYGELKRSQMAPLLVNGFFPRVQNDSFRMVLTYLHPSDGGIGAAMPWNQHDQLLADAARVKVAANAFWVPCSC